MLEKSSKQPKKRTPKRYKVRFADVQDLVIQLVERDRSFDRNRYTDKFDFMQSPTEPPKFYEEHYEDYSEVGGDIYADFDQFRRAVMAFVKQHRGRITELTFLYNHEYRRYDFLRADIAKLEREFPTDEDMLTPEYDQRLTVIWKKYFQAFRTQWYNVLEIAIEIVKELREERNAAN